MKKSTILVVIAGVISILLLIFFFQKWKSPSVVSTDSLDSSFYEPVIGVFELGNDGRTHAFSHYALKLDKPADEDRITKLVAKIPQAEELIITMFMPGTDFASAPNALRDVINGEYDAKIEGICNALAERSGTIYLRWNPEMEVPVRLYPWQYQAPNDYIQAFNHFSKICKSVLPGVKMIWGAAGYPGTEEYWPGGEYVDYVSVTIDGKSELKATAYPPVKDKQTDIRRKIRRMRFFDKPVLVLNSGADSEDELKAALKQVAVDTRRDSAYLYHVTQKATVANPKDRKVPLVGVYDPKEMLVNTGLVDVEHIFVFLTDVQTGQFEKDFRAILSRKHDAIVTIEPWRDLKLKNDSTSLQNVLDGVYDERFREIYRILSQSKQTVYLRFAHEMEIPIRRYAWQSQEPVLYIKAYRYFMNFDKSNNKYIKKVWGPAGDRGSMEWWPGDDVVDYISIAIYGLPDKNITDPEKQESFEDIYNRKSYRMSLANKPFFITEFGVKGLEDFQKKWLLKAAKVIGTHPEIKGVSYFNLADNPEVWGDIPAPDWSVSKETFQHFVEALKEGH